MILFAISVVLIVATVALASHTHEGSWLVFFESLAGQTPRLSQPTQSQTEVWHIPSVNTTHVSDNIVAMPSLHQSTSDVHKV